MGGPMAGNLLSAGHSLAVFNRTASKASRLAAKGAHLVKTPADAAKNADTIFICVTSTEDVEQVLCAADGILATARRGSVIVDHSTISPAATRDFADKAAAIGVQFVDAPVSGGDIGARDAPLSIMCGGDRAAFDRVEPLLRHLGKAITYCGPSGAGQSTKLVNQILVSVTLLGVSEALVFARKSNLNLETTLRAVLGGAASSWQLERLGPKMITGDNRPGFTVDLQQKDLSLLLRAAEDSKTSLPAASLVHQLFAAAQAAGHGKDGTQSLYTVLEKLASSH
jgi:3-hydroxyisobutyrate dehydrogenase